MAIATEGAHYRGLRSHDTTDAAVDYLLNTTTSDASPSAAAATGRKHSGGLGGAAFEFDDDVPPGFEDTLSANPTYSEPRAGSAHSELPTDFAGMAISPPKAKTAHAAAAPVGTVACTALPSVAPTAEPPHAKGKGKGEKPTPMASEQWAPADDLVGMGLFMPRAPQDVLDLSPVADMRRSASALSSTSSTSEGTEKASGSKRRTREKPLRPDGKPTINLIFMGHVDAGKSTLNGHLLHLLKD